jgi:aminoglycoside 6'-N-acetyltransferase I
MDIRILTPADADVLNRVADGVFDNAINPGMRSEFLADPRHHLCVAIEDGVVIAMASAVHYTHPDFKRPELWINEVGTSPDHRRKGAARAVLEELKLFARRLGCGEAWVLTDEVNEAARALYRSVGGAEQTGVVQVNILLD